MADKKTKKELFNELLLVAQNDEQKAFIKHELELLEKKHNPEKPTKAQEENIKIKEQIFVELVRFNKPVTISDLQKLEVFKDLTNQKLSALIRQLVQDEEVVRTEEKRVAYFEVAPEDEPEEEEEIDEEESSDEVEGESSEE